MGNDVLELKTGIYRHFKGKLYFVEGLEQDADSNEEKFRVRYRALYPGKNLPFSRSLEGFTGIVDPSDPTSIRRFTMVRELPTEKMWILLPKTQVGIPNASYREPHTVEEVQMENNSIFVKTYCESNCESSRRVVALEAFLKFFFVVCSE